MNRVVARRADARFERAWKLAAEVTGLIAVGVAAAASVVFL